MKYEPDCTKKPEFAENKTVCVLLTKPGNPRNSEGDFVTLADGRILFAYSRYSSGNGSDDDPCDIAGLISDDGAETFTELSQPLAVVAEHGTKNIMSVSLERLPDGKVALFYLVKKGDGSGRSCYVMRSAEKNSLTFGDAETVIPYNKAIYYVVNNCRTQLLANGSIAVPAAEHPITAGGIDYVASDKVFLSDNTGHGFKAVSGDIVLEEKQTSTGLQEPGISVLPDGTFHLYARTDLGCQYESFSADGVSWSSVQPSSFTSPTSPMIIERNPYSGIYYAIWNPFTAPPGASSVTGRTPLAFAHSRDGIRFSDYELIETDTSDGYCYPAVHFLNEREMLVSYCFGEDGTMKVLSQTRIRKITLR